MRALHIWLTAPTPRAFQSKYIDKLKRAATDRKKLEDVRLAHKARQDAGAGRGAPALPLSLRCHASHHPACPPSSNNNDDPRSCSASARPRTTSLPTRRSL